MALGAQKRFQGEREREERIRSQDLKLAGVMGPLTGCVRPFVFLVFLCMSLGHAWSCIEPDSRVLCVFSNSAKQLCKCSFISPSFLFFRSSSPAKSNSELYRYRISFRPLGKIQALKEGCCLLCFINFHSQTLRPNQPHGSPQGCTVRTRSVLARARWGAI